MRTAIFFLCLLYSLSAQAQTPAIIVSADNTQPIQVSVGGRIIISDEDLNRWDSSFIFKGSFGYEEKPYTRREVDSIVNCAVENARAEVGLSMPKPDKYKTWHGVTVAGIGLFSGVAYGFHETSVHHPWNLPAGWNKQFWDNRISWQNKYKNGDPLKGAKFPGSNTILVATTDGKHLTGSAHRTGLFAGGLVIGCTFGKQRSWEYLIFDTILFAGSYLLGFHFTYSDPLWRTP